MDYPNNTRSSLPVSDAVAAIMVTGMVHYVLQLRDRKPDIWYPDCWGLFGGAIDAGERPDDALQRELEENVE